MVFQNKLDYASSGYHAPAVPHFPRSLRMKRSVRKRVEDPQTNAIDLLANIASKLLAGSENILTPRYKSETSVPVGSDNDNLLRFEAFDQLSCNEEARSPEDAVNSRMTCGLNHSKTSKSMSPGSASLFQKFGVSDETAIGEELKFVRDNYKVGISVIDVHEKCGNEELHSTTLELLKSKELMSKKTVQGEKEMARDVANGKTSNVFRAADPMNLDTNFPDLVSSDSSVKVSLYRKNVPQTGPFGNTKDDKGTNEDKNADDNSSGCSQSIFTSKEPRLHRTGDHGRIKKILSSKFSKVAPTMLQEDEIVNYEKKTSSCSKRMSCTRQRTPISSFKRRKWFERYSSTTSDRGAYCEGVSNSCKKNSIKSEPNDSHDTSCGANGAWSSRIETKSGFNSPDYHVKLSIKSFEVPELVLDLPETATVGSLKRAILDAVTAILGGGLHVGVVLEGKKVADDNKTLHQAGISHGDELDNLGFILEPSPRQTTGKLTSVESPHLQGLRCSADPLAKVPPVAAFVKDQRDFAATQQPVKMCPKSDHDSIHSQPIAASHEKLTANSLALVVVPPVNMEALAMVPLHSKPKIKRAEAGQRRARRPFSVAEVEALVHAVEKLGTGRWRDVKLCAFENAKHRTYVDLKDKWKTLVHTAEISPQQRRGEPVPQELLDRVLSAHAYWSQQQSKLQAKPLPPAETRLLLS